MAITNAMLFELWRQQKRPASATSTDTQNLLFNYIKDQLGSRWPSDNEMYAKKLESKIKGFCCTLSAKWKISSSHAKFVKVNQNWMARTFSMPLTDEIIATASTSGVGRRPKTFAASSDRTKRRKLEGLKESSTNEEIVYAAKTILRSEGKRSAATLLAQATETSPKRPSRILQVYRKSLSPTPQGVIPYSADQALALLLDSKISTKTYTNIRMGAKAHNAPNLYPPYNKVKEAKVRCYPTGITVDDFGASVPLQSLLDHTAARILQTMMIPNELENKNMLKVDLVCKYGCDGSSGYSEYMQIPSKSAGESSTAAEETTSDKHLFLFSLVPLRMIAKFDDEQCTLIWQNAKPSSTRLCRPIKLKYIKETSKCIKEEVNSLQEEISTIKSFETHLNELPVTVSFVLHLTMVDGKVINALTGTSSQSCYICKCKPTQMNDLKNLKKIPIDEDNLKYGLSTLHAWIKFLECVLHIAYRLELKAPTIRGASQEQRARIEERKKRIQHQLWTELGIKVDKVVQGGGTSNTGNVARRFFKYPDKVSKITGVDEDLIRRFGIILSVLASGEELNYDAFKQYTEQTAHLFVLKYNWYRMPVSVHKILVHGPEVVKSLLLPIGMLSEEAQEASNKNYRRFREHHTRKTSRINTTTDLFHMLLASSDPVISKIRGLELKTKCMSLDNEARELIKPCSAADNDEKEEEEQDEVEDEDEDDIFFG